MHKPALAIIGSGVAGITAAYLLQQKYRVVLYEKNSRLGGHTNTVVLEAGPDAGTAVDTGFIVLNNKTYPLLHRLLEKWECQVRNSDMSFGFHSERSGFHYAGTNFSGLFAQRSNLWRPSFYRFLRDILTFGRRARADLENKSIGNITLADYTRHLHPETVRYFIVPMAAAIWSATQRDILQFPAASMLTFWRNHGLLSLDDRPQWQTVAGGSHAYVKSFARSFTGEVRLGACIKTVRRDGNGATIMHSDGHQEPYDALVMATHADEALGLLEQPTRDERRLLGTWRYQENRTLLHTDVSFLPRQRRAWASWNYIEKNEAREDRPVPVTYWMNLLQGLNTKHEYLVTLNPDREPAAGTLIKDMVYHHPVYDLNAVATQDELPKLQGVQRTWYCGSYFGHGFHEDAVRSSVTMAAAHGVAL